MIAGDLHYQILNPRLLRLCHRICGHRIIKSGVRHLLFIILIDRLTADYKSGKKPKAFHCNFVFLNLKNSKTVSQVIVFFQDLRVREPGNDHIASLFSQIF